MGAVSWLTRVRIVDLMSERLTRPVRFGLWNLGVTQLGVTQLGVTQLGVTQLGLHHSVAAAGV